MENTRKAAIEFVKNGGKCLQQYGFSWKGASSRSLTNESALSRLTESNNWNFGKGFYELEWKEVDGETYLKFTEYSLHDME